MNSSNKQVYSIVEIGSIVICSISFSALSMQDGVLRIIALALLCVPVFFVANKTSNFQSLQLQLGILPHRKGLIRWVILGILLGIGLAAWFRVHKGYAPFPGQLRSFVWIAILIGALEELIFRGFVQQQICHYIGWGSIILASAAHTAYKCSLFLVSPLASDYEWMLLGIYTLIGGMPFGLLRHVSKSVFPPLMTHVLFDIMVYGDYAQAPWWVWGIAS